MASCRWRPPPTVAAPNPRCSGIIRRCSTGTQIVRILPGTPRASRTGPRTHTRRRRLTSSPPQPRSSPTWKPNPSGRSGTRYTLGSIHNSSPGSTLSPLIAASLHPPGGRRTCPRLSCPAPEWRYEGIRSRRALRPPDRRRVWRTRATPSCAERARQRGRVAYILRRRGAGQRPGGWNRCDQRRHGKAPHPYPQPLGGPPFACELWNLVHPLTNVTTFAHVQYPAQDPLHAQEPMHVQARGAETQPSLDLATRLPPRSTCVIDLNRFTNPAS